MEQGAPVNMSTIYFRIAVIAVALGIVTGCSSTRSSKPPLVATTASAVQRAATPVPTPATAPYPAGTKGYSISWPQCGVAYPPPPFDFGMVGVTDGIAFTHNPCFADEYRWAVGGLFPPTVYWNVNYVECGRRDPSCDPRSYGYREAQDAYDYAASQGAHPAVWWLDIQTVSDWSPDETHNAEAIRGAIQFFIDNGVRPAISSTRYQLGVVAGPAFVPGLSSFVAGREDFAHAEAFCADDDLFAGRGTELTAYPWNGFEGILSCGPQ